MCALRNEGDTYECAYVVFLTKTENPNETNFIILRSHFMKTTTKEIAR